MDFLDHARRIGFSLLAEARTLHDGSLAWSRESSEPPEESGLYAGRCGEALLLAALSVGTEEPRFADAARLALLGAGTADGDRMSHGLAGLGGLIYALVQAAGFLGAPDLLDNAERLARSCSPERIAEDLATFDIISGTAGTLLGLLALADAGSSEALRRADLCGTHLLANRSVEPESRLRAWSTKLRQRSIHRTGFAHGASGIACALLGLARRTGAAEPRRAALEAMAFERTLYRQDLHNWDATRVQPRERPRQFSWCHGAPGIALSRLAARQSLRGREDEDGAAAVAQDLRNALEGTVQADYPDISSLCCGAFGRIEVLLEAGIRLDDDLLVRQAQRLAWDRLTSAATGASALDVQAGFWKGSAGIAYTLLRLAKPGRYPCVLALG